MKIELKKVTWYSQILALALGIGIFFAGFYIGANKNSSVDISPMMDWSQDNKPVSFYKLTGRFPTPDKERGIIESQEQFDALYSDSFEEDFKGYGDWGKKPFADFERNVLLYQTVDGIGCNIVFTPIVRETSKNELTYTVEVYEEGTCEMGGKIPSWVAVPRPYLEYDIIFETKLVHSDLR
jgi:hypothetical protein